MSRRQRWHVAVSGAFSCQALVAAVWAALPEQRQALPNDWLTATQLAPDRWAVGSRRLAELTWAAASREFPGLAEAGALASQVASAGEWAALAWLRQQLAACDGCLSIGPLPLPTTADSASAALLRSLTEIGWPVKAGDNSHQHSQLAIAAFAAAARGNADSWQPQAYGCGQAAATGAPDLLLSVGCSLSEPADLVAVLEANIDDQNPEFYQDCLHALLAAGALDVLLQPVLMKKQRPGILLAVLCRPADADRLADLIFQQTSTLGIRRTLATRYVLRRCSRSVRLPGGEVRVKLGYQGDRLCNVAPEYEDCRVIAAATGTPVKLVYQQAIAAFWQSDSKEETAWPSTH